MAHELTVRCADPQLAIELDIGRESLAALPPRALLPSWLDAGPKTVKASTLRGALAELLAVCRRRAAAEGPRPTFLATDPGAEPVDIAGALCTIKGRLYQTGFIAGESVLQPGFTADRRFIAMGKPIALEPGTPVQTDTFLLTVAPARPRLRDEIDELTAILAELEAVPQDAGLRVRLDA